MKKNTMILAAMGLTAALCAGSVMSASAEEKKVYNIGICQLVQHDALDAATKGFEEDYIIARKVLKKFESMNVSFVRDEITGLIDYIEKTFGKGRMPDSCAYLERIRNLY